MMISHTKYIYNYSTYNIAYEERKNTALIYSTYNIAYGERKYTALII